MKIGYTIGHNMPDITR